MLLLTSCRARAPGADPDSLPRFVRVNYIDLDPIERVSRFRSAYGHSYTDSFESCRSMKHYFEPARGVDWSRVAIVAPVDGEVIELRAEWAGTQVVLRPAAYPAYRFIIFHVRLAPQITVGTRVTAGQTLGAHIGAQTLSDIAVGRDTPEGYQLVSYFDVMSDSLFAAYQERGVQDRAALIIDRGARDADPLTCRDERFTRAGRLDHWVRLSPVQRAVQPPLFLVEPFSRLGDDHDVARALVAGIKLGNFAR